MKVLLLCIMNTSRAHKAALNRKHLELFSCEWLLSGNTREEDKGILLSKCAFNKLVESFVILLQVGGLQSVPAYGLYSWRSWWRRRCEWPIKHFVAMLSPSPKAFLPFLHDSDIKLPLLFDVIHLFPIFFLPSLTVRCFYFQVQLF